MYVPSSLKRRYGEVARGGFSSVAISGSSRGSFIARDVLRIIPIKATSSFIRRTRHRARVYESIKNGTCGVFLLL